MGLTTVRPVTPDEWHDWRVLRRAALADAPYAFQSTLAEWSGDADTEQHWRQRLEWAALDVVADLHGRSVGMAGVTPPHDGRTEIISMWVDPAVRGQGVGDALITHLVEWARARELDSVALAVRVANTPAIRLYERHGFVDAGPATEPGAEHPERRMVLRLG